MDSSGSFKLPKTFVLLLTVIMTVSAVSRGQSPPISASATIVDGLGTYSRKISTDSEIAQKFFDQGLRLTYGYYFPEAIASFQQAQQHDPEHPMIYRGSRWRRDRTPTVVSSAFATTHTVKDVRQSPRHALASQVLLQLSVHLSKLFTSGSTLRLIPTAPSAM